MATAAKRMQAAASDAARLLQQVQPAQQWPRSQQQQQQRQHQHQHQEEVPSVLGVCLISAQNKGLTSLDLQALAGNGNMALPGHDNHDYSSSTVPIPLLVVHGSKDKVIDPTTASQVRTDVCPQLFALTDLFALN